MADVVTVQTAMRIRAQRDMCGADRIAKRELAESGGAQCRSGEDLIHHDGQ